MNKRDSVRTGLSDLYKPAYDILCANLSPDWQPYEGYRSPSRQDWLYTKGRAGSIYQGVVTNDRGWESSHNYGCGSDWTIFDDFGKPIWLKPDSPRWGEYQKACDLAGVKWGGIFKSIPDFFHNELKLCVLWKEVGAVKEKSGLGAALDFIEKNRI